MVCGAAGPVAAQSGHVTVVVRPDLQTGKLIRSVVVQPKEVVARVHEPLTEIAESAPAAAPLSTNVIEMIDQIAKLYEVEGPLVHSVIRAESNYNPQALSNKGAGTHSIQRKTSRAACGICGFFWIITETTTRKRSRRITRAKAR